MAQQRITISDKNTERILNLMFKELYDRTNFVETLKTFKEEYSQASSDTERLAVVAEYLKLI